MPALRVTTNVPVECRLTSVDAETAPSSFGADQLRYRTDKGDLYVSPAVGQIFAAAIAAHGLQAGAAVRIIKAESALGNGRKGIRWTLEPLSAPAVGNQPDGSFAIPKPPASEIAPVQSTALNYTMTLIDAYAAAVRYANEKHSGVVTPERVWSIFATVVIGQQQRNGGKSYAA